MSYLKKIQKRLHSILFNFIPSKVNLKIAPSARVYSPSSLKLGLNVDISRGTVIKNRDNTKVKIGDNTCISEYCILDLGEGYIELGKEIFINSHVVILGHLGVIIDDYVHIGPHSTIASHKHIFKNKKISIKEQDKNIIKQKGIKPIKIGRDALIGANCVILDGVQIGEGAIIGAGSVVTGNIPKYSIAVGSPAKVIKKR